MIKISTFSGYKIQGVIYPEFHYCYFYSMKFDICVGNPPYQGKGDPLYMQITKVAYDTVLDKNGVMCMINPTGIVDNKFEGNDTYETLKKKYSDCKLSNFIYEKGIMGVFTSVEVGNDLGIFYYSKNGEHTLFDDWTKQIRFGDEYFKDRDIIKSIKSLNFDTIGKYESFKNVQFGNTQKTKIAKTKYIKTLPIGHNYVVCSFNRGNRDKNTGDRKWDWTTLMNSDWFIVQNKLPYMSMNFVDFDDDKQSAINLIKWINTDFIQYLVLYYKASISNSSVLFENLPQPPASGDFSDESLMKEFGLTEDQMKHIHKKMKLFGWKTKEELIPDHKESSLLQFIDDLNNGKVKLPESKKGKKNTPIDPDSSPSGSGSSKTVLDN